MAARKVCLLSLMIGIALLVNSCTQESADRDKRIVQDAGRSGGVEPANAGLVGFIKKQRLVNFPSNTIGNALDSYGYLKEKAWRAEQLKSGHVTVDFTGRLDQGSVRDMGSGSAPAARTLEVKFVVEPNGSFYVFMVSLLEPGSDGSVSRSQLNDTAAILSDLYANRKLPL